MIDALALFASHLFDLASVWNVVRELLTLSKRRMASRSSRLAAAFALCDLVFLSSKASIDQNELQLITSLMLQWTLGFIAVVPIFNVWHIFWDMTFLSKCYWNKHMFMNKYMCFSYQILFFVTVFSQKESVLTFDLNIFE